MRVTEEMPASSTWTQSSTQSWTPNEESARKKEAPGKGKEKGTRGGVAKEGKGGREEGTEEETKKAKVEDGKERASERRKRSQRREHVQTEGALQVTSSQCTMPAR